MIRLPKSKRGRKSAAEQALHADQLSAFYAAIMEIDSRLDFKVSARGWCYLIEQAGAITKGEFGKVEDLITAGRKSGALPMDICCEDKSRDFGCLEYIDTANIDEYLNTVESVLNQWLDFYRPISFWDDKPVYIEMLVEKIDLRSLFEPICREINLPIANAKGWPDMHIRAAMMRRYQRHEAAGRQCVLLYCGDHDPAGIHISDNYRAMFADIPSVGWMPDKLVIDRFGINLDFIAAHKLTWIDNLITSSGSNLADPKHHDHARPYVQNYMREFGERKVEANALVVAPQAARALCRDAIEKYLGSIETATAEFESRLELPRRELRERFTFLAATKNPAMAGLRNPV